MAQTHEAIVGITEARELMPRGRQAYTSVRHYINNKTNAEQDVFSRSPVAKTLIQVLILQEEMIPPLPESVIGTIGDFIGQYDTYIQGEGYGRRTDERLRLENVAEQLVSVVFEYGYVSEVQPSRRRMGTEM